VEYPEWPTEEIQSNDINAIKLVNTDAGPVMPDIWLVLAGKIGKCIIPHGNKGFDFTNFGKSMTCTNNAEFILWKKN
jgi:hypothetical protein